MDSKQNWPDLTGQYDILHTFCKISWLNGFHFFQQILSTDFEIGHFLRARVIPKAALYYTGDIVDDDDDDDFDEGNWKK